MRKIFVMLGAALFAVVVCAEDYDAIMKSGRELYNKRKFKESSELYEKAVKASSSAPQEAAANRMLAYSYAQQGNPVKAAGIFEKISANAELPAATRADAAKNAIVYYCNAKEFDKADKVAEAAKGIKSDDPVIEGIRLYAVAYSLNACKQSDKALEAIKQAKEKCQGDKYWDGACDMLMLEILFQGKKYDELIAAYPDDVIEQKAPGYQLHYYYRRALAKKTQGDSEGAAADFQKTFEKSGNTHYTALYFKALCLSDQKKYKEALDILNEIDAKVKSGWLSKSAKKQIEYIKKVQQ